jgi:UDP:flavonoid glycosyltransferase YjiC (YdhE family)
MIRNILPFMSTPPARVVCLPNCAYLSETTRMIAIQQALQRIGIDSILATHGGTHEHIISDSGIAHDRLDPLVGAGRSREFVAATPGIGSPRQSMWTDDEIRATSLAEQAYFESVGATAVVTGFQLTTLISGRLADIPLITSHAGSWVPPVLEAGLVPAQHETPPPALRRLPRGVRSFLANKGALRYKGHTAGFNRVARELGVEPIPSLPALLSGDLTLVTEAPELLGITASDLAAWRPTDRTVRAMTRMRCVGPLFARLPMDIPPDVQEFLEAPGDVAYVALTSTSEDVVDRVTAAVRATGLRVLVATTVHGGSRRSRDRVLTAPFLPSHLVMPRVRVAVVTGGQGSVQTALASGTPLVGIPLQPEQEWNVSVAVAAGAARMVGLRDLERRLPLALLDLLRDEAATTNAQRVARVYARYDAAGAAAAAIDAYLTAGRVPSTAG